MTITTGGHLLFFRWSPNERQTGMKIEIRENRCQMTFLSIFWVSPRFFFLQNQRLSGKLELKIFWCLWVEYHEKMTDMACFDPRKEANLLLIDIMLSWILLSHQRIVSRYQSDWEYVTFESSKSILHSAFFVNDPRFFTRIKLASDPKQNLRDLQSFSWKNSSQMIAVQSYGEIVCFYPTKMTS